MRRASTKIHIKTLCPHCNFVETSVLITMADATIHTVPNLDDNIDVGPHKQHNVSPTTTMPCNHNPDDVAEDTNNNDGDSPQQYQRRFDRALTDIRNVQMQLRAIVDEDKKMNSWKMLENISTKWGGVEDAHGRVRDMLTKSTCALHDIRSLPQDIRAGRDAEWANAKKTIVNIMELLYYMDHSIRVSAVANRLVNSFASLTTLGTDQNNTTTSAGAEQCDEDSEEDSTTGDRVKDEDLAAGMARFVSLESEDVKLNKFQQLILFLLNQTYLRGYRRYGGDVYERNIVDDVDTYSWKRVSTIRDFIFNVTRKEVNFTQWCHLTSTMSNANSATEFMSTCKDPQFGDLVKNRHVFSFPNGIYITDDDKFYTHDVVCNATSRHLTNDSIACKYFDVPFVDHKDLKDWMDIPTPTLQCILNHQKFSDDVSRFMYIFIGRVLYEVGSKDAWQVIPFLKGQAGTGKSTLLMRVCANFFDADDVGVLSNNIERKFGLSAIMDKLLFVAPEIKGDLHMEQAEFQSVISGEAVQINIKCKRAQTVPNWSVPGILAGNEAPKWVDNAGSVSRRLVIFEFGEKVENADMQLSTKLASEMPAILQKCNRAYREAVEKFANDSIWHHLPAYFHKTKQDLMETVNSLESFLASSTVVAEVNAMMPYRVFTEAYNKHCIENSLPKMQINKDFRDRLRFHGITYHKTHPCGEMMLGVRFSTVVAGAVINDDDDIDAPVEPDCGGDR